MFTGSLKRSSAAARNQTDWSLIMVKRSNSHVWVGLGFIAFAIAIAAAVYGGMRYGSSAKVGPNNGGPAVVTAARSGPTQQTQPSQHEMPSDPAAATAKEQNPGPGYALSFNAIGAYVNKEAGNVCEGERWALIGADDDPNGNHLVWQGESGEYREFSYNWDGKLIRLTDVKTGEKLSFPMLQLDGGFWMVKGERLEECAG